MAASRTAVESVALALALTLAITPTVISVVPIATRRGWRQATDARLTILPFAVSDRLFAVRLVRINLWCSCARAMARPMRVSTSTVAVIHVSRSFSFAFPVTTHAMVMIAIVLVIPVFRLL
jgi:hypothetical protein